MPRSILGLALLLPLIALSPAHAGCFQVRFTQVGTGSDHYVLLPAGSDSTDESLVGRFWQVGEPAVNQGNCNESNWLHPCESDCPVQSGGAAFYVDGDLSSMPCSPACPDGEMVLLLENRAPYGYGEFFAARVDESPAELFDFSRLGVDLSPIAIPRPIVQTFSGGTVTVRLDDPAPGFYGLPGVPATATITAFRLLKTRGGSSATSVFRTAWTEVARFPYSGGMTTGSALVGDPCPANGAGPLNLAVALELEGSVLTDYVSRPLRFECSPEQWFGGGHAAESGSDALKLSRSAGGELTLTWGASCVTPNSFALYEGVLGDWTSHVPRTCAAGSPASFFEPAGNAYYLIVPEMYNLVPPDVEGSHGLLRDGSERPRGAQTCIPDQVIVACP